MLIFDGHCDSLSSPVSGECSLNVRDCRRQLDFAGALGQIAIQSMAVFVDKVRREEIVFADFLSLRERLLQAVADNAQVKLITSAEDLRSQQEGSLGVLLTVEGAEVMEGDLANLERLYALGVRSLTLTWNNDNFLASGNESQNDHGLTVAGRKAVNMMERLKMAVDIAHLSSKSVHDVLKMVNNPVIDSHGCCRALCDHPRNLTDGQIKGLASTGGVLGIAYVAEFLHEPYQEATIDDVVCHIAHVADLVGVAHVGLGSDFDGVDYPLCGLEDVSKTTDLIDRLARKGFHQAEIAKIMGGNFWRVYQQILA